MATKLRKLPPVCLGVSIVRLLTGKLQFSCRYKGTNVKMKDGEKFTIFRHVATYPLKINSGSTVFIVRFKFARLSHKANKLASIIPMLLITGFPGFDIKMYSVNIENGYWQGMYQWRSKEQLEEYKRSFVFRMMNKRAIGGSLSAEDLEGRELIDYIEQNKIP